MLRVTRLTDYATVVLTVLAARPGTVLSAPELAEAAGLETTTVAKVLKPLAQAGLVDGFRGAGGGNRRARDAGAITHVVVLQALERPRGKTECSIHAGNCGIEASCGVRANWRRINDVVADALRGVTLAQMLAPPPAAVPVRMPRGKAIPAALANN
jgi:FeS assembly SUF system regulator